jgi:hypothetical protein
MAKITNEKDIWKCSVQTCEKFNKMHAKPFVSGVQVLTGRVKGTERWEIQGFTFLKANFKTAEDCRAWLDSHLKGEIQTLLDFKAWNEYRRRAMNAFLQVAEVTNHGNE